MKIILCLLLIFIFINSVKAQKSTSPICMSSCGEIQNISYPFRLKTDPTNCGDLGYELSCVNNKTILRFQEGNYFIKKINYTVNLIRVVDIKFANANRSCNLPSGHIQSESELDVDFYYHGTVNHSYVAFLNCSENITLPNFIRVPCVSINASFVYAMHYDSYLNEKINNLSCKTISVTPVDNIEDDQKPASYEDVLMLLRSGFDLRWSVECRNCTLVGQGCVIPSPEKPWVYKCEKHHSEEPSKLKVIVMCFGLSLGAILIFGSSFVLASRQICRCYRRQDVDVDVDVDLKEMNVGNTPWTANVPIEAK